MNAGPDLIEAISRAVAMEEANQVPDILLRALALVPVVVFRVDRNGVFTHSMGSGLRRLGLSDQEMVGRNALTAFPAHAPYLSEALAGKPTRYRGEGVSPDGKAWAFDVHVVPDGMGGAIGVSVDVTDQRAGAEIGRESIYTDVLTGLPNRLFLTEWMAQRGSALRFTLLYLDLVGFREINEIFGYALGDDVLSECAERLRKLVPKDGVLARIGDDSFAILADGLADRNQARQMAVDMIAAIEAPFTIKDEDIHAGCNVGIVLYPEHIQSVAHMFQAAELALTRAVTLGRGEYALYNQNLERQAQRNRAMANTIRRALREDRFRLVYQPKVDAKTGRVRGVEALLRHDGAGADTAPVDLIEAAERTRLIEPIGAWALEKAAQQLEDWRARGHEITVSVNVSAIQMRHAMHPAGLLNVVRDCLSEIRAPAEAFEIEVTESAFMDARSRLALARLDELGVRVVVDDFGTGWSSFGYLKDLRLDGIKIDRSFVNWTDGASRDNDGTLCRSLIEMGHALGLRVVAEGVETRDRAAFLRDAGCDELQGFLFSRPVEASDMDALLRDPTPFADLLRG